MDGWMDGWVYQLITTQVSITSYEQLWDYLYDLIAFVLSHYSPHSVGDILRIKVHFGAESAVRMLRNICILLWKNLLMRRNHYFATASEFLVPIILIILANTSLPKIPPHVDNDPLFFDEFKSSNCSLRHSHYESVIYEPYTPFTKDLMNNVACYAGYKPSNVKPGAINNMSSFFSLGVMFNLPENISSPPEKLNYTIYPTNEVWKNLNNLWRHPDVPVPRYSIMLLRNVIEMQRAIDVSFLNSNNLSTSKIHFENTDVFDRSPRIFTIVIYLALILTFSLMVPPIIGRIVHEKYTGAKELMLMMGVKKWELWVAKFIDSFLFLFITVSGMVIFLYVPLKEDSNVLSIPFYIFWGILLYGLISIILFLFFLSCFFGKANLAVYISEVIWVFTFVLSRYLDTLENLPSTIKYLTRLFPHVTLMNAVTILLSFDTYGKDVNLTENLSDDGQDPLWQSLLFMFINIILYSTLTWYVEQVKPGKYGVPKPLGFCFTKSYWSREVKADMAIAVDSTKSEILPPGYEQVPDNLRKGISIQKVSKVFKSLDKGPVVAVDDVTLDFYHSEISALLGHNGAGKTTMFSMITGLINPTSGAVFINGYNLALNTTEGRRSLGLCPQKDMLFDDLTVLQILKFYGVIKGLNTKNAAKETKDLIEKLKLENVVNTQTCNLSGGQKRKVSLAIALIGGSKVLVLDEPTSGMDPEIRREIWEMLLGFRGTRTILLTTHFMEEADALCDRIAIMDCGKIKCFGSPMYLKSKYGKGYILSVVLNDAGQSNEMTDEIKRFIPSAKLKSQNIRTVSYELPESEVPRFPSLLSALDMKQGHSEIVSYGISVASLEDVFLKLRSKGEEENGFDAVDSAHYVKLLTSEDKQDTKWIGYRLFLYQFWALLIKKCIFLQRQWKIFILYLVLAGALVVVTTLFAGTKPTSKEINFRSNAPIVYTMGLYSPFLVLFSNPSNSIHVQTFPDYVKKLGCDVKEVPNVREEIYKIFKEDYQEYSTQVNLGVEFKTNETMIYHNDRAIHMIPIGLNLVHNFLLKIKNLTNSISASTSIMYLKKNEIISARLNTKCVLPDIPDFSGIETFFYFMEPLKESIYGAKELQLMITPTVLYWFSHMLFDLVTFAAFLVVICLWFGLSEDSQPIVDNIGDVIGCLLLWGVGMLLIAYIISSYFKTEAGALSTSMFIYIIFTFILKDPATLGLPKFFIYLHPTSILKQGFSHLCNAGPTSGDNTPLYLFIYDLILFGFLILEDSKILSQVIHYAINRVVNVDYGHMKDQDELVDKEKTLVDNLITKGKTSGFALIVRDLKRWYLKSLKPSPTVRGLSFTVKEGECFGLLGVNGAGKTSTFRMLTGTLPPSSGVTYLRSETLTLFNRQKYLFQLGYCPQMGGLIPVLKGRELVRFFARLRGIKNQWLNEEVEKWLQKLDLLKFGNQKCGTYSGGNQRKLSTAVALVGDSPLIFLDEPTSGVDPGSRRLMWNVIDDVQKQGQSIILTSHSMDECEALCSRLAIMVSGKFRCLGEITTLKKRFGQGYSVQLKVTCGTDIEEVRKVKSAVMEAFESQCSLVDEHLTILQYHVTNQSISWSDLFTKLKTLKENFGCLESYSASETTLEQIFIYLARNK